MEDTEPQQKKRRRNRIATPPPCEQREVQQEDIYDSCVSGVFQHFSHTTTENLLHSNENTGNNDDDLEEENHASRNQDTTKKTETETPKNVNGILDRSDASTPALIVDRNSPSPPPPVYIQRSHRLANGVRAALNKLEQVSFNMAVDLAIQEEHKKFTEQAGQVEDNSLEIIDSDTIRLLVIEDKSYNRYELQPKDKIFKLKQVIAQKRNITSDRVLLFCKDQPVMEGDTVESLGLTVADTVEACIVDEDQVAKITDSQSTKPAGLTIKVQGKHGQRDVINIQIEPTQPLEILMKKFAEEKKLELSSLTFRFDGEEISPDDTPEGLDMDDGDCIDVTGY